MQAFVPFSVANYSWRSFLLRSAVDPNSLLKDISWEVMAVDPGVRVYKSTTLEGALKEFYRQPQFELATIAAFAAAALLLMIIGMFSVMAYTVALRTHEIGVRIALGARQSNVARLVLSQGLYLVLTGTAIGIGASYAPTRFLASGISGASVTDPETFVAIALLVVFIGLLACMLPAREASRVEPLMALRYE